MKLISTRFVAFAMLFMMVFSLMGAALPDTMGSLNPVQEAYAVGNLFDGIDADGNVGTEIDSAKNTDFNNILDRYSNIVTAITGFLTITMFAAMIFMFTKLGVAGDNEQARRKAIGGILTCGIATALLGGATIVIGFFFGALDNSAPGGGGGTP